MPLSLVGHISVTDSNENSKSVQKIMCLIKSLKSQTT